MTQEESREKRWFICDNSTCCPGFSGVLVYRPGFLYMRGQVVETAQSLLILPLVHT